MHSLQREWDTILREAPPHLAAERIDGEWRAAVDTLQEKIIVLDDDPTGTQTVHSIPVYTSWNKGTLERIRRDPSKVVYILTNSRALPPRESRELHLRFARNLVDIFDEADEPYLLISRSDSTLRGHYPLETETLHGVISERHPIQGECIIPFFLEGGRVTVDDIHYVKEGPLLTPVARTEFARDAVFGYRSSNLRNWIEEKTSGRCPASAVTSISLAMLRSGDVEALMETLAGIHDFGKVVVNALDYADLKVFVTALAQSMNRGMRFLFRTAASFVQVVGGITPAPLLTAEALYPRGKPDAPGLVVAGSHVDMTTRQIEELRPLSRIRFIEWDVHRAVSRDRAEAESRRVIREMESAFDGGRDVCVYTSRTYAGERGHGTSGEEDLRFSRTVSEGLVRVVRGITRQPGFLIAKGGVTSSDIAVKGLGIGRATVMGQILPGIPVWRPDDDSRFPGLPYIVFPGNVGNDDTLKKIIELLR